MGYRHLETRTQPSNRLIDPDRDEILIAARWRSSDPEYRLHIWAGTQTFYVEFKAGCDGNLPVGESYHDITRDDVQAALDTLLPDPVCGARYNADRVRALGFSVPPQKGQD
jgi:hypothetical protein